MFRANFLAAVLATLTNSTVAPQVIAQNAPQSDSQVMFVLDGSNSMWGQIDGVAKITIAKEVMTDLIQDWDESIPVGLVAYGHRRKGDCTDIELISSPGKVNRELLIGEVQSISPRGKTPISQSLFTAANSFEGKVANPQVVLVSDGLETCEGDPCSIAYAYEFSNPGFDVHVVGFDVNEEESKALQCIAEESGGLFFRANNADELQQALRQTLEVVASPPPAPAPVPDAAPAKPEPSLILYAKLCESCEALAGDFRWTVWDGDRVLHDGLSDIYPDAAQLAPGEYGVEVRYRSSPLVRKGRITIGEDGAQTSPLNLNGGAARLFAFATDDRSVAADPVFYRFAPIVDGQVQEVIADSATSNAETWLPAGRYKVTVEHEGLTGAAEVDIVAGQTTDYSFDLRFGEVRPRVTLYEGGKITGASITYAVYDTQAKAEKGEPAQALATSLGEHHKYMSLKPGDHFLHITYRPSLGGATRVVPIHVAAGQKTDLPITLGVVPFRYQITREGAGGFSGFGLTMYAVDAEGNRTRNLGNQFNSKYHGAAAPGRYVFVITNHGNTIETAPFELVPGHVNELGITIP